MKRSSVPEKRQNIYSDRMHKRHEKIQQCIHQTRAKQLALRVCVSRQQDPWLPILDHLPFSSFLEAAVEKLLIFSVSNTGIENDIVQYNRYETTFMTTHRVPLAYFQL